MDEKRKLKIAFELACGYDYVPYVGDEWETIEDLHENFTKYMSDEMDDVTPEELQEVIDEYQGYDTYELNNKIRRKYFSE